ncbi:hypothetical protein [Stackebrandtia soli]
MNTATDLRSLVIDALAFDRPVAIRARPPTPRWRAWAETRIEEAL